MTHNIQQLWNGRYKSLIKYSFPETDKCPIFGQNRDFIAIVHFTGHRWCIHKRPWIGLKSDLEIINLIGGIIRLHRLIAINDGHKSDIFNNKINLYLGLKTISSDKINTKWSLVTSYTILKLTILNLAILSWPW